MAATFQFTASANGGRIALKERGLFRRNALPIGRWPEVPNELQPAVRQLMSLMENGLAVPGEDAVEVSSEGLLSLPATICARLSIPELTNLVLKLELVGRVESPDGHIKIGWHDAFSRPANPSVFGILVDTADGPRRLSAPVFALLKVVEAYNKTRGQTDRITSWQAVQNQLATLTGGAVKAEKLLLNLRIHQAGAFALDVRETPTGPVFDPVLMSAAKRASLLDDAPPVGDDGEPDNEPDLRDNEKDALLSASLNSAFARAFLADALPTRPSYVLAPNTYLVVESELRTALDMVKQARRSSETERRAFLRNPRTYLANALPDLGEAAGSIFVETKQYSDRVRGLGLWQKPKLDWLVRKGNGWLPEGFAFRIGERRVQLDEQGVSGLAVALDRAVEAGADTVTFDGQSYRSADVASALDGLRSEFDEEGPAYISEPVEAEPKDDPLVLQIEDNIDIAGHEAHVRHRPQFLPLVFPSDLVPTPPKPHQQVGFRWLVQAWSSGLPGALLADDMGLGKTLQALAFLAWFRANRAAGATSSKDFGGPILIVAPTALLRNWRKESETHLVDGALGDCLEAFGPGLKGLRTNRGADWTPEDALDVGRIRGADWILTTYETLSTYHRAFARVPYAIAIFDEMQKIKAPDTINSHSAKTINANFVIGLTGTPIENRIEDIWCIMDRVSPGYLGGMKDFSRLYGGEDQKALIVLKAKLDQPTGKSPPIMLRRMKSDHLKGLPERSFEVRHADMPPTQADAYDAVVWAAKKGSASKQDILKTIHDLRGISLHPNGGDVDITDPASRRRWIAASARVSQTMGFLRDIAGKGEKALVFIEDRAVQGAFASVVAEELGLRSVPPIINGSLDGDKRQAVVDRFQTLPAGFGLLVLSPKAAGIGLTITAANHVIHLSRWWNPAVEDQCNDRVYRIGQERPVTVHLPLARHPHYGESSFDLRLEALLERKRALSRDMLVPSVWESDLDDLFSSTVGAAAAGA